MKYYEAKNATMGCLGTIDIWKIDSSKCLSLIEGTLVAYFLNDIRKYIRDETNAYELVKLSISCKPLTQQHQSHQEMCTFRQDTLTDILCAVFSV